MRHRVPDPPAEVAFHDGLAYSLWAPSEPAIGAVVILHGAGSSKESHYDFARACRAMGFAAVAFDQRGHGESEGDLDDRIVADVAAMARLARDAAGGENVPLGLRGSSMGGYVALVAAEEVGADAVVAICPASAEQLLRGLHAEAFELDADVEAVERFLTSHDVFAAAAGLRADLLLMHAEGDEQVPADQSRELHRQATSEHKRLIVVPGGHHRSVQHDGELQAEALRFLDRSFARRRG
jgi:alpha-beta hydrolase superfamily lysophospholipase